jgi:hypothetical protein
MFQFTTQLVKSLLSVAMVQLKVENIVVQSNGKLFQELAQRLTLKIVGLAKFWLKMKMYVVVNALHACQSNHQLVQNVTNSKL